MTSLTIFCDDMLFKNIQKYSNAKRLLVSLNNKSVEYPDVIDFINHIAYNRQKSDKIAAQCRYTTAIKTSKMGKKMFIDTTITNKIFVTNSSSHLK